MANPLYNKLTGGSGTVQSASTGNTQVQFGTAQNAPQTSMLDAMNQLRSNPIQMIKQAGYNVPDDIANNPPASVMHLLQTGQIKSHMMERIQQWVNMVMGRR